MRIRRPERKGVDPRSRLAASFDLPRLRPLLKTFRLHWFSHLRSTNDHATVLRKRGELFAPAVVLTSRQTHGRGRGANTWWSAPGSLTATFVLAADETVGAQELPLIAGLAVRNALAELSGDDSIQLKWPNDVVYRGRKLAGLLCERIDRVDLVGIGINLNTDPASAPAKLRDSIASLSLIRGQTLDATDSLAVVAGHLLRQVRRRSQGTLGTILGEYQLHHCLAGRRVTVDGGDDETIRGQCQGIDASGRLIVRDSRGKIHRIVAGQVGL